jgi:hypothetical protein
MIGHLSTPSDDAFLPSLLLSLDKLTKPLFVPHPTKSPYHDRRFPAVVICCSTRWNFGFSLNVLDSFPTIMSPVERSAPMFARAHHRSQDWLG